MATSKFLRTFRTVAGVPITTATIWLVPQANTYPTGALALTPHGTRDGQYYRDNVPDGEYKIYIDPSGGSSPTLYEEEIWIGEARITTISDHFDAADSHKLKTTGIKDAAITAALLATDAVETAKIKDLNVTNAKIANATILPAKLGQQTVTVVSTTNPTPSYIGQQGRDASGNNYVAIALSGTMWEEIIFKSLKYPVFTTLAGETAAATSFYQICKAIKTADLSELDPLYYYKIRSVYRNNATFKWNIYLDRKLKSGGSWAGIIPSTTVVTENTAGSTFVEFDYTAAYGKVSMEINYNEFPAGDNWGFVGSGDLIFDSRSYGTGLYKASSINYKHLSDQNLVYPCFTKFNTGVSTSDSFNLVCRAIKNIKAWGFDLDYYYKVRAVYRNHATYKYTFLFDRKLKTGGSWENHALWDGYPDITENSLGVSTIVQRYIGGSRAEIDINYNEITAGIDNFSFVGVGDLILNESKIFNIESEDVPEVSIVLADNSVGSIKLTDDALKYIPFNRIVDTAGDANFYSINRAIKYAKLIGFNTENYYRIRNVYRNQATFKWNIYLAYRPKSGGAWSALSPTSTVIVSENSTGETIVNINYGTGIDLTLHINYNQFPSGDSFPFIAIGDLVFSDDSYYEPPALTVDINEITSMSYHKALGARIQNGVLPINTFIGSMIKNSKSYKVSTMVGKAEKKSLDLKNKRKFFAMGWADFFEEDYLQFLPLLAKYDFRNTFYIPEIYNVTPMVTARGTNEMLSMIFNQGSSLENHSFFHFSSAYTAPEMDGYTRPTNAELQADAGGGKNAFGYNIADTLSTSLQEVILTAYMHNGTNYKDKTWTALSSTDLDDIRKSLSVFRRPTAGGEAGTNKMLEHLDYLSNLYLGTTGYGRVPEGGLSTPTITNGLPTYTDTKNESGGIIQGGIFQGASTTNNHEIWERLFELHDIYHSILSQRPVKKQHYSPGGGIIDQFSYSVTAGTARFYDAALTKKASIYTPFVSSINGATRDFYSVCKSHGYYSSMILNACGYYNGRTARQYHIHYKLNSVGLGKQNDIDFDFGHYNRFLCHTAFTAGEWLEIEAETNLLNWLYTKDSARALAGTLGFYNTVREIVKKISWGIIPANVDDSGDVADADQCIELEALFQFCYLAGIEIIDFNTAHKLCFEKFDAIINLFPNDKFERSLNAVLGVTQNEPDGWNGGTTDYDSTIKSNILIVPNASGFYTRQYFIQSGKLQLKFKALGTGTVKVYYLKNSDPYSISDTEPAGITFAYVDISEVAWADITLDLEIPIEEKIAVTDATISLEGLDNQICGLQIVIKCTGGTDLRIGKPSIYKIGE